MLWIEAEIEQVEELHMTLLLNLSVHLFCNETMILKTLLLNNM